MGCEIDVAFFWTNILTRSSLSGGIALFPMFLGQSVSLNTGSLQISHLAKKKEKKKQNLCSSCQHEIWFELLRFRQGFMYGCGIFNVVFHIDALLLSFGVESENLSDVRIVFFFNRETHNFLPSVLDLILQKDFQLFGLWVFLNRQLLWVPLPPRMLICQVIA